MGVTSLDVADLNDDNDIDIIVGFGNYRSGPIFDVRGNDGTMTPSFNDSPYQTLAGSDSSYNYFTMGAALIADLNGDGNPDLLGASSGRDEFAWYEHDTNNPAPVFNRRLIDTGIDLGEIAGIGASGDSIAAAELTGDSAVDLLLGLNGELRLYESNGANPTPTFSQVMSWSIPGSVQAKAVDMNGDTHTDIVFATSTVSSGVLGVLYSNGATPPEFTRVDIATDGGFSGLHIGDIDLDGAPDILTTRSRFSGNVNANGLRWYSNDGAPAPAFVRNDIVLQSSLRDAAAALGDIDEDGDLDIVFHVDGTSSLSIFDNQLDPALPVFTTQPASREATNGEQITLTATTANFTTLEWFFKAPGDLLGIPIADSNTDSLTVTATTSGVYTCVATNTAGSTNSAPAFVVVGEPGCPQDLDLSGVADFFDVLLFLNQIDQGCPTE